MSQRLTPLSKICLSLALVVGVGYLLLAQRDRLHSQGLISMWREHHPPAVGPCFDLKDATGELAVGWRWVELPKSAQALSAPEEVEQFRSGQPTTVWEADGTAYGGTTSAGHGRTEFRFDLQAQEGRVLAVDFVEPLDGAKVDARLSGPSGDVLLFENRRVAGTRVWVEWTNAAAQRVTLMVHKHLRHTPQVRAWQVGRTEVLTQQSWVPAEFRSAGRLYFFHPGGVSPKLCQAPGRHLSVQRKSLQGPVTPAALAGQ